MSRTQRALALLNRLPPMKREELLLRVIMECVAEEASLELPVATQQAA